MRYLSTRRRSPAVGFSEALKQSLAPDGGLYVPESFPEWQTDEFDGIEGLEEVAKHVLQPMLEGDPLHAMLPEVCAEALNFPLPLVFLKEHTAVLEVFHGPTAAFKDVGARFLAALLARSSDGAGRRTVLVATSGDTGGAVAAAFHEKPGIDVLILFPKDKVSPRQEKQLTSWRGNVRAFAVRGDFDDCQRIAKEAFADREWNAAHGLISANSINIGRLLPQVAYYATAALEYFRKTGRHAGFIVPSGNLGNAIAGLWAKAMGLPIREIVLATNANHAVIDYFSTGVWLPHPTIPTLANAMDVGNPSNFERMLHLYPDHDRLKREVRVFSVNDIAIRSEISSGLAEWGQIWCPHTATAVHVRHKLEERDWIIVATAHPAKFDTIVEPLVGQSIVIPPALAAILERPSESTEIGATLREFKDAVER